eukprot:1940161-Alexandrium_andersonii.AAC.1
MRAPRATDAGGARGWTGASAANWLVTRPQVRIVKRVLPKSKVRSTRAVRDRPPKEIGTNPY